LNAIRRGIGSIASPASRQAVKGCSAKASPEAIDEFLKGR
jgi:hypothetical protein